MFHLFLDHSCTLPIESCYTNAFSKFQDYNKKEAHALACTSLVATKQTALHQLFSAGRYRQAGQTVSHLKQWYSKPMKEAW